MFSLPLSLVSILLATFPTANGCNFEGFHRPLSLGNNETTPANLPASRNLRDNEELSSLLSFDEDVWKENKERCLEEDYKISLYIYSHMALVATPADKLLSTCKPITLDAVSDGDTLIAHHRVVIDKSILDDDYYVNSVMLELGVRKLKEIADVFETVVEKAEDVNYDIVEQNCAVNLLKAAHKLSIPINKRVADFAVNRLADSGTNVMPMLRQSDKLHMIFPSSNIRKVSPGGFESVPDKELIYMLVKYHVDKHNAHGE